MYYKNSKSLMRPKYRKYRKYKSRQLSSAKRRILSSLVNFVHVFFILFMSLVVVKATAIAIHQNRTTAIGDAITSSSQQQQQLQQQHQHHSHHHAPRHQHNLSHFQATTSDFITTVPQTTQPVVLDYNQPHKVDSTVTNHIIRTNIIVGGSRDLEEHRQKNMRVKLQQLLQREKSDDEEKRQLQQEQQHYLIVQEQLEQQQQQQQYQQQPQHYEQIQQQQQQQDQHQQLQLQQPQHAMLAGENAYLLERIDGAGVHEQPIYGTWSTKARRPQAPPKPTATTTASAAAGASTPSGQTLIGEVEAHQHYDNQQPHHYERLPRRSSTMTPVRRELHDQIPRPPRLTSRQPSMIVRRQFNDTPLPSATHRDEPKPKPFHFPFDGPLPEEFKNQKQSERGSLMGLDDVNNIQDILQKIHLGSLASTKIPPMMMMPTGLHISGSYKNLKSSGIANFFRGKRNKKQMQLQFPLPMPLYNAYQAPLMNLMPQTYQQRIAMDQIYPFKARSPNDINLLAMQQHQQQQHLKVQHGKNKKQKKKPKDKKNPLASNGMMMPQYPFATAAADMLYPSMFPPYMALNLTQAPPLLTKRIPFKVNLDIFPVLPPTKNNNKPMSYLAMDEARIVSSMRPPTVLRNPFAEYFTTPVTPTTSALGYYNPYVQKPSIYNSIRFPGAVQTPMIPQMAQANNMQLAYSEQLQKYLQQQQQQQHHQQQQQQQQHNQQQQHLYANILNGQGHQTPFLPIDCDQPLPAGSGSASSISNTKTSPIMLHLNVFPKQKPASISPISTNPFYNINNNNNNNIGNGNVHRTSTIQEENEAPLSPIEPRHQAKALNISTSTSQISRSDNVDDQQRDLVDFEHPIVAANDISELPTPAALVGNKPNESSDSSLSFYDNRPNFTEALNGVNNNYQMNSSGNLEQMVSEAKTASLFRFPVEDLIQFQVHDAM